MFDQHGAASLTVLRKGQCEMSLAYSAQLFVGLGPSHVMPLWLGEARDGIAAAIRVLTMTGLALIMVQVGFEFLIGKTNR